MKSDLCGSSDWPAADSPKGSSADHGPHRTAALVRSDDVRRQSARCVPRLAFTEFPAAAPPVQPFDNQTTYSSGDNYAGARGGQTFDNRLALWSRPHVPGEVTPMVCALMMVGLLCRAVGFDAGRI